MRCKDVGQAGVSCHDFAGIGGVFCDVDAGDAHNHGGGTGPIGEGMPIEKGGKG